MFFGSFIGMIYILVTVVGQSLNNTLLNFFLLKLGVFAEETVCFGETFTITDDRWKTCSRFFSRWQVSSSRVLGNYEEHQPFRPLLDEQHGFLIHVMIIILCVSLSRSRRDGHSFVRTNPNGFKC